MGLFGGCSRFRAHRNYRVRRVVRPITSSNTRVYYSKQTQASANQNQVKQTSKPSDELVKQNAEANLDFNALERHSFSQDTDLGKWIEKRKERGETNLYRSNGITFLELKSDGEKPTIKFFDTAGNEWKLVPREMLGDFYQNKEKLEEREMEKTSSATPQVKTGSDAKTVTQSKHKVSSETGDANATAAVVIQTADKPEQAESGQAKTDVYLGRKEADGSGSEIQIKSKGSAGGGIKLFDLTGADFEIGNFSIFGSSGSNNNTASNGSAIQQDSTVKDSAIAGNAATNGMSQKEKDALNAKLDAILEEAVTSSDEARQTRKAIQTGNKKVISASEKTLESSEEAKEAAHGAKTAAGDAKIAAEESSSHSKAAQEASQRAWGAATKASENSEKAVESSESAKGVAEQALGLVEETKQQSLETQVKVQEALNKMKQMYIDALEANAELNTKESQDRVQILREAVKQREQELQKLIEGLQKPAEEPENQVAPADVQADENKVSISFDVLTLAA